MKKVAKRIPRGAGEVGGRVQHIHENSHKASRACLHKQNTRIRPWIFTSNRPRSFFGADKYGLYSLGLTIANVGVMFSIFGMRQEL